jgi:alginate O-acetyltransferase complex protein AlgI
MALSFTSLDFVVFLALCVGLVRVTRSVSAQKWLLIAVSCVFYLTFGVVGISLISLTAVVDFNVGRRLGTAMSDRNRRQWLWASLAVNLGALLLFKTAPLLAVAANSMLRPLGIRTVPPGAEALLPVGLSYFTFAGMSYVLDVYYERLEPSLSFPEYFCYLVYFPKIVAGPIVRAAQLLPEFRRGIRITAVDVETGCGYFLVGAVQKVIADQLAQHVGMILAAPQQYDGLTLLQGMVGYTVQIYADFSGYSDMAIGCARLMGIRFPQNFLMPYSSVNIAEFWRRWHVTMSNWFRDYVFLPLEVSSRGMRKANLRASRNVIITMLLCGLWHGATWNFVVWGGLHGVALAVYQVYVSLRGPQARREKRSSLHPGTLSARALTLSVVMLANVFFGTQTLSLASMYLSRMLTWSSDGVALGSPYILPLTAVVFVSHLLINKDRNLIEEVATYSVPSRVFAYASLLVALTSLVPSEAVPFVYVQF